MNKILIANRGEIALRAVRACHELGIPTVAVYSTADELSLHVRFADEAVCIGPPQSQESYLNIPQIISAAEVTGSDAIHPGYGFLAENPEFAQICSDNGFIFIGPSAEVIQSMGDKASAKATMKKAGVPVIPGSDGVLVDVGAAGIAADEIGYPVILKASAGGGGKGMRIVHSGEELEKAFTMANAEAEKAFNNGALYLEKYIEGPRHIEFQIFGDQHGNIIHFGERECSIQRRHQKLVEESPSPVIDDDLRKMMGEMAVRGAKLIDYVGAGTVEFLFDDATREFYFMEMNTRIQVEHPVTEMVIGKDLLKMQIKVAAGDEIPAYLASVKPRGHALECRINAEDPANNFAPSPKRVDSFHAPGGNGVRMDTHVYAGYQISPYYDSLIAKLIVHGDDRSTAINRMQRALEETIIEGPHTTIPYHQAIMRDKRFRDGAIDTSFIESFDYSPEEGY
ncbi:MAG: acetyl-CoA carboxylase biotin carboxylase subunit [Candidatus Marinimicrobia bacterium]|mgnify:CR=1 FL=1|jgi:acetyl-CoA carboxylase biotin carboxylase subunit|nr:acetyl-CoA carboxylase biotin carboxylase subunit [Candidatus Neomarinimicrobiota bacterium]MDP6456025.1 acetyl-CoA carboxylase biotin carboxylase subunit [Candidatus Neomarinimicrobiota bacterium]MDP6592624.1 acetyl-CoA carboxylase biotin carboxylase subunit [Candidatus Neomarinimicrobiota bacterium]MDP6836470.1 acetyl-CoA carboxylase biotin carboxylase subunit [Candidatus Neomarinimicrobiota bacterium]MDP6966674.1 acetyl-CoA carboxylase biotin carboxylase subunit [Candidatus Neomarinimicro|tara:strand:+ start:1706 stop:3064 length:1359 start_codon:yes stop_codon:yes gene_type:complete